MDKHLEVDDLRHELRQSTFVVKALERFAGLFLEAERKVTVSGDYFRNNLGQISEGLGDVSFAHDIGTLTKQQSETHSLEAFAKARARCFALLKRTANDSDKLGFADIVSGRALSASE